MASAEETSPSTAGWAGTHEAALAPEAPRRRLFRKYALIFVALVGAALLINSGFDFWFSYQENKAALVRVQQEKAESAAQRIAEFVEEIKSQIGWTTHAQWAAGPLDQRRQDYVRLLRQVPAITELRQLDPEGKERLLSSRLAIDVSDSGTDFSQSPAFIEAKSRRVWFSPVYFRKESEPYMSLTMARDGRNAGVTVAEINLKLIWDVITALKIGQGGYAYVVDGRGRLIAHPDISLVLRDTDLSRLPQVAAALNPQPGNATVVSADNLAGHAVLTAHALIPQLGWRVFVELPRSEAFAPLWGAAVRTLVLLAAGLIAATLVALVIARRMTGPIHAIAEGAERIGAGELGRRIDIHTGDELEGLARQFNRMAADLQKSYAELEQRVRDRTAELSEALERQTATAEVLGIISSSPGHLEPVFEAVLANAVRICGGRFGLLALREGDGFRGAAAYGVGADVFPLSRLQHPPPGTGLAALEATNQTAQVADCATDPAYEPVRATSPAFGGMRTALHVAMLKEGELIGAIIIYRGEVLPFRDKEIELVENFAKQAVIAIENVRLITETREALDQQTATAEVLGVINASPGDLAPVFDAMLDKALHLCGAAFGHVWRYDGEFFHAVALRGAPESYAKLLSGLPVVAPPGTALGEIVAGKPVAHLPDITTIGAYREGNPGGQAVIELGRARTTLAVPLRKDGALLGTITAFRQEVKPFSDKQIALLQNFAAQAVIAMENARLITETREALEQQTATAEVLQVISNSLSDTQPVFDAIVRSGLKLFPESAINVALPIEDQVHAVAIAEHDPTRAEAWRRRFPVPFTREYMHCAAILDQKIIDIADVREAPPEFARGSQNFLASGYRAITIVPMRRGDTAIGALSVVRLAPGPLSEKQLAVLRTFASQAVIAIENTRLLNELRERTDELARRETSLRASDERYALVTEAAAEGIYDWDIDRNQLWVSQRLVELFGWEGAGAAAGIRPSQDWNARVHPDDFSGYRAALRAALKGETPRLFCEYRVRLSNGDYRWVEDHAVPVRDDKGWAVRLVGAVSDVTERKEREVELRDTLEQQTATAEVLGVINSSPGDLAPVFDSMLEKAMRLCEANFGNMFLYDDGKDRSVAIRGAPEFARWMAERGAVQPAPGSLGDRLKRGEDVVHITDAAKEAAYAGSAARRAVVEIGGFRTLLAVALRKGDTSLGGIVVYRKEVRPFTDKQIALLQNFAAQAVIAMENARLITETREALEQQTATAEVLGVINSSPGDLAPVFEAMLERAMRLCGAAFGELRTYDGDRFKLAASRGAPAAYTEYYAAHDTGHYGPGTGPARLLEGERFVHIPDLIETEPYHRGDPDRRAIVDIAGARAYVLVPLLLDNTVRGFILVYRREPRPFTDKQIALLQNFAAQAVIAMENARLITETREALEQQTATAEVLGVINSSPGDLAPVFDAVVEKAMRLCGAAFGQLHTFDGERWHTAAMRGLPPAYAEYRTRTPPEYGPGTGPALIMQGENVVHIEDIVDSEAYRVGDPARRALADLGGARSYVAVALRKDRELRGVITIFRQEVRLFSDKQIGLLQNFAAQAVIAMENARLLGELRGRTRDLQESLEYQTATSDVLKVISQSVFELDTVLQTVVATALRLCRADTAIIYRNEGGEYRWAAGQLVAPEYEAREREISIRPGTGTVVGRAVLERRTVHILDAWTDPLYEAKEDARIGGVHTMIGVPLLREGVPIGVIALARQRVEAFTPKQIELVTTFADQAVIAIENARLLGELRERTDELARSVEELKALAEVGQAVSSTLDLGAILSTVLNRSLGLTEADAGVIFRFSQNRHAFRFVEAVGWDDGLVSQVRAMRIDEHMTLMGEAVMHRAPAQIADLRERPGNILRDANLAAGYRSVLIVPLVGVDRIFGALLLQRRRPGKFPEAAVRLMQTLAAQSVLAIQNARLFREIADKSEELRLASQHKSQFLANMSHELRTPLNAILGYSELLVDGIYGAVPEKAMGVLERVQNNGKHLLALINDVLDLSKIEAGQLVLTLEDYALPDVVQSVVNTAEGLANSKGLKFSANVASGLPTGHGDARRLSQVLLNLVGNAVKFTDEGEVAIRATAENGHFVLTVRDTGPGIAPADHDKIFGEFQQVDSSNTRKKGGTGLGLAISKRMVEMQGGTIDVESVLGHGATFRVTLPIRVESVVDEPADGLAGAMMGAA